MFEFINSYIMLIYQAVFEGKSRNLAINVGSIVLTRGFRIMIIYFQIDIKHENKFCSLYNIESEVRDNQRAYDEIV